MSTMVVVAYEGEDTAEQARAKLLELQKQELIGLSDAVSSPHAHARPHPV